MQTLGFLNNPYSGNICDVLKFGFESTCCTRKSLMVSGW
jgi:hypothetical protein